MSLVVVGSVAYDGVETPHGRVERMLGGAATYISLAASYFTQDAHRRRCGRRFRRRQIPICWPAAVSIWKVWSACPAKPSSGPANIRDDMNDRTTLTTDLNVFADFNPKLPESYQNARRICCSATSSPRCSAASARR